MKQVRTWIGVSLLAAAAVVFFATGRESAPPAPPAPVAEIDLTGAFRGPTAAEDAMLVASMADEVGGVIEWDGRQAEPKLTTGKALDQLRTRTREFLCRGESLGERHPRMRQIVADYLETKLGVAGGTITPEQRAAWVAAYREVSRAARHVVSQ